MVDIVPKEKRSEMMAGIKGQNTKPETILRKALYKKGLRYRLHVKNLPGKPDLVFHKHKAVIFINGCFWHKHSCHLFKWPSTRPEFWQNKINGNCARDEKNRIKLSELKWRTGIVWECALKGKTKQPLDEVVNACYKWIMSNDKHFVIQGTIS